MTDIPWDERGAPDLQELVRAAGGYGNITSKMWKAFDNAMSEYRARHRFKHHWNSARYQKD